MGFETGAGEFMTSSVVGSYNAAQMRRSVFAWAARAGTTVGSATANTPGAIVGGLFSATDMQLSAASSGLVVNTSTGECLIPGQEASNQGGYHGFLSSTNSTTLATANTSNPRIDAIVATSADPDFTIPTGGTSGYVTIQGVTGTPTSGATLTNLDGAPTIPLSSLLLGYVLVPANATSLSSGDILNVASAVQLQPYIPGQLLAKTIYAPGSVQTYDPSTSALTVLDATNLTATITAPASGAVTVRLQAQVLIAISGPATGQELVWGIMSGGSQLGPVVPVLSPPVAPSGASNPLGACDIDITRLTPGDSYTLEWAAFRQSSDYYVLAGDGAFTGAYTPPAVMKVYAA